MQREDVYETDDLPESDQAHAEEENFDSEHIAKINLKVSEAYQAFRGKGLQTDGVDFSDSIGRRRKGYGGETFTVDLLKPIDGEPETVVQHFRRLQAEIRDLTDKVEQLKVAASQSSEKERNADELTLSDVHDLQKHLKQLQIEQILGTDVKFDNLDQQSNLFNRVTEAVDRVKQLAQQPKEKEASLGPVTYELYCPPISNVEKTEGAAALGKLSVLEARLSALEKLTGTDTDRSTAVQDARSKNILESVDNLEQRLSLLDSNQLDLVDARLSIVLHKLTQFKDKKASLSAEQTGKVDELYEMMSKWDAMCSSLPHVVSRLQSLKELHEQALQFSQCVTYLDGVQQELNKAVESDSAVLNEMKDAFVKNLEVFKNNCENIEKRIKSMASNK